VRTVLRLATRASPLARWQAGFVAARLVELDPGISTELVLVETTGDRRRDVSLASLGGQGVFVKEVEAAVLDGRADAAVHSAKDLPSSTVAGLRLASIPVRADARDALVGSTLDALRPGARVATGSVRRRAQLSNLRPDLTFADLRGNIATRIAAASDHGAVVVAACALDRLVLSAMPAERLSPALMTPQVGQGAIGVECRVNDDATAARLAGIEDQAARRCVDAERAFLAALGGGCDVPVGALATIVDGALSLTGLIASVDGRVVLRHTATGALDDPGALGREVALFLKANGGEAL